jgi:hypothetical protein
VVNLVMRQHTFIRFKCCLVWRGMPLHTRSRVRFPMVSLVFSTDIIIPAAAPYGRGVDSACDRNEYQEYFPGDEGGRCVVLTTLPPSCAEYHEIWEPQPATLRACPVLCRDCFTFHLKIQRDRIVGRASYGKLAECLQRGSPSPRPAKLWYASRDRFVNYVLC